MRSPWRLEPLDDVVREDQIRIKSLRLTPDNNPLSFVNFREKQRWLHHHYRLDRPVISQADACNLADRIELGHSNEWRPTLASAQCMRAIRGAVIPAMLDAFEEYADADLATFTAIKKIWNVSCTDLSTTVASRLRASFRTDLNRAGVVGIEGALLAFLHGEFDPVAGNFQLHWHGLTTRDKAALLPKLKSISGYETTATGSSPIRKTPVKDRPRQFSYLLKSYWPERGVRPVDGTVKRDRRGQRIKPPFDALYLLWLDQQRLRDITVFSGGYSPRLGGSDAMRRLYSLITMDRLAGVSGRSVAGLIAN